MKRIILVFIGIGLSQAHAQNVVTKKHFFPIETEQKIYIDLEGDVDLNSWDVPKGEVEVQIQISGFHWAIGGGKESKKQYAIEIQNLGETIRIVQKKEKSSHSIGISALRVTHRHIFHLSRNAEIILRAKDANIRVNGNFKNLDIENEEGTTQLELKRDSIRCLECFNYEGKIAVGDSLLDKRFRFVGEGDQVYSVITTEGDIELLLF